ncbi:MAG: hypothetical protein HEQ27_05235 [Dolichospermum sp. JUN01]|nr:hypothetical protein [Dolichospermum sp. JUN01]MBS9394626.1 hypothetical protein [Dolichospermum sp. OL01]MCO5798256.1 hypothetical protein [Dolichospermum sp. OL03]MCS6281852.1 hypothetical protein [Dolichospermum sp.]QSV59714.1 MAG: hypothetical protein HEQ29_16295 [Dolichospermum sp. LBC05a]
MPATHTDLFDNNTTHITSVVYSSTAKKLEITFTNDLNAAQAASAIMQSINNFLVTNTDLTINLSSSALTRTSSIRNGVRELPTLPLRVSIGFLPS